MRVLVVSSGNSDCVNSFVIEQAQELEQLNIEIQHFLISGKGFLGYLKNLARLKIAINSFAPDIVHAHYGLSGLLANLQRKVPVVTTYHGSDINNSIPFLFSKVSILLSCYNIFVSKKLAMKAKVKTGFSVVSCGVDLNVIKPVKKEEAKLAMKLSSTARNILFSSSFDNKNKNYSLARAAIDKLAADSIKVNLIELNGYSREEVNLLLNGVDCVLVTSFKESGPLVIKEAMAVNKPAVSVDVGDVRETVGELEGYYLTTFDPEDVSEKLQMAFDFTKETQGLERIIRLGLDSKTVALTIRDIYLQVLRKQ